ncbi:MAG: SGNH/GDSL hydrolase family protein, partial [Chloroflexi bacterium]|nr:SGNH/GDSL hydrolase family protein [Chloroflexota bacterium]
FMGGSITDSRAGWNWPEPVLRWFKDTYPQVRVRVENGAIGATGSDLAVFRAQEALIGPDCDLVFIEYAVNDGSLSPELRSRTQEGLLRKLLAAPGRDIILVYTYAQDFYTDMLNGRMPPTIAGLELLGQHYGLGAVWMSLHALREVQRGLMRWEEWLPDGLHPQSRGSLSYGQSVIAFLQAELAGANTLAPVKQALPQPLNPKHWGGATVLPLEQVRTEGPWTLRRWYGCPFIPYVWDTAAVGAALEFDFTGRGLALGFDFGNQSGEFRYQIDDGSWQQTARERFEWAGLTGWFRLQHIADDLDNGQHHFMMQVIHGNLPECKGTDMSLGLIGIVR